MPTRSRSPRRSRSKSLKRRSPAARRKRSRAPRARTVKSICEGTGKLYKLDGHQVYVVPDYGGPGPYRVYWTSKNKKLSYYDEDEERCSVVDAYDHVYIKKNGRCKPIHVPESALYNIVL